MLISPGFLPFFYTVTHCPNLPPCAYLSWLLTLTLLLYCHPLSQPASRAYLSWLLTLTLLLYCHPLSQPASRAYLSWLLTLTLLRYCHPLSQPASLCLSLLASYPSSILSPTVPTCLPCLSLLASYPSSILSPTVPTCLPVLISPGFLPLPFFYTVTHCPNLPPCAYLSWLLTLLLYRHPLSQPASLCLSLLASYPSSILSPHCPNLPPRAYLSWLLTLTLLLYCHPLSQPASLCLSLLASYPYPSSILSPTVLTCLPVLISPGFLPLPFFYTVTHCPNRPPCAYLSWLLTLTLLLYCHPLSQPASSCLSLTASYPSSILSPTVPTCLPVLISPGVLPLPLPFFYTVTHCPNLPPCAYLSWLLTLTLLLYCHPLSQPASPCLSLLASYPYPSSILSPTVPTGLLVLISHCFLPFIYTVTHCPNLPPRAYLSRLLTLVFSPCPLLLQNSPSKIRPANPNPSPHQLPPLPSPPLVSGRLPPEAALTSLPQQPQLKLTRVQNQNGIVLSWCVEETDRTCAAVDSYHLYAYHRDHPAGAPQSLWKKIGEVKALPLPMACTLTQFVSGSTYYFAVCARDIYNRFGPFCEPQCTDVISSSSS